MNIDEAHQFADKATELADRLGIEIPGDIHVLFWALPLLEKIVDLLEDRDILNEQSRCYKPSRRPVRKSEVDNG